MDDALLQLGLTFEFQPDNELRALGKGNKWWTPCRRCPNFGNTCIDAPHLRSVPRIKSGGPSLIIKSETDGRGRDGHC